MVLGLGLSLYSLPRRRFGPREPQLNSPAGAGSPALPMSPLLLFPEPDEGPAPTPPPPPPANDDNQKPNGKKKGKGKGVQRKPVPKAETGGNKGRVAFLNSPTLIAEDFYSEDSETPKDDAMPLSPLALPMANAEDEPIIEDLFHEIERDTKILKEEQERSKEKEKDETKDENKEEKNDLSMNAPSAGETSASEPESSAPNAGGPGKKKKKKKKGGGDKPEEKTEEKATDKPPEPNPLPPTPDAPPAPPKDELAMAESNPLPEPPIPSELPPLPEPPKEELPKEAPKDPGKVEVKIDLPAEITLEPPPPPPPAHPADEPPKPPTTTVSSSYGDMDSTVAPLSTPPTSPPTSRPTTPVAPPATYQYDPQTMFGDGRPSLLTVAFHAIAYNKDSLGVPPPVNNEQLMNSTINMVDRDVGLLPNDEKTSFFGEIPDLAKELIRASNELRKAWHESQQV
ncbi:hypothetical protein E3Q01_00684 [Wallemia mellicola]|uniref:Uncharacterized protein n=1 Tax=Wallemia mellicola TaxID=1708541 RepID=A0A4T0TUK4_9BASI|nr:hypothetical protein E3Q01_00684 [Wallemia mellicola]